MKAKSESAVMVSQRAASMGWLSGLAMSGWALMRASSAEGPPMRKNTTKTPTARKAVSLTSDSTAMARISPS